MSIIRWGEHGSDVYVYEDVEGRLVCCACDGPDAVTADRTKFLAHLDWHRKRGDAVPALVDEAIAERIGWTREDWGRAADLVALIRQRGAGRI